MPVMREKIQRKKKDEDLEYNFTGHVTPRSSRR